MKSLTVILIVIIVIVVLAILIFNAVCHRLIFVPPKYSQAENQKLQRIGKDIPVVEYLPASNATVEPDQAIVYSHGNGTDIRELHPFFQTLASELKTRVYAYEYPGYSYLREQLPNGPGCTENLRATIDWLIKHKGYSQEQITLVGRSLGSGPTVQVAKQYPRLSSVVLISAYKSLPRIIFDSVMMDLASPVGHLFPNYNDIAEIRSPITFIHGGQDDLIPSKHSQDMFQLRQTSKHTFYLKDRLTILDNEGHNMEAGKTISVLKRALAKRGKLPKIEDITEAEAIDKKLRDPYVFPIYQETRLGLK